MTQADHDIRLNTAQLEELFTDTAVGEHFAIGVPFARAINPVTKTNWEGTGVTPDVAVPADKALDVAYRAILEKMVATTSDPQRKGQIEQLLNELKKTP